MAQFSDYFFESSTGQNSIHARKCIPDGEITGVVQLSHGIAEYIRRYDAFAEFLADNGFVVVGNDHLGHGESSGLQGHFADYDGWNYVLKDMNILYKTTKKDYPDVPYIFFGHSMGSFLTRNYIINYPDDADAVILSGTGNQPRPLILSGIALSGIIKAVKGKQYIANELNDICFGSYNKGFTNARTSFDWLSRDNETVDKYMEDEKCGFVCTASLYNDMMKGINVITTPGKLESMNKSTPVYFMSGSADPVGDNGAGVNKAYKMFCDAGIKDVTIKLYPEGRHEMLNEINKEQVMNDILAWIKSKI